MMAAEQDMSMQALVADVMKSTITQYIRARAGLKMLAADKRKRDA
jgi:hypothetical protein